jgi:protein SCO1/2
LSINPCSASGIRAEGKELIMDHDFADSARSARPGENPPARKGAPRRTLAVSLALAYAFLFSPGTGTVRGMEHDHGQGHGTDHRHHHEAMAAKEGFKRSVAPYETPDVALTGADGAKVPLRETLGGGKPVVMNFIFTTCPTICPVMTATFSRVREMLGPDRDRIRMVSITIDPEYDTPAVLKEYGGRFSAGPDWLFLTGSLADIVTVERAFDAYRGNKMNHAPFTFLRASPGAPWTRLDGILSAAELEREVRSILPGR